jgi:hypothetical protein
MTDLEFSQALETCALPNDMFHHSDHLRLAWIYLRRYGPRDAYAKVAATIRNYAGHLGASHKYHETITLAWVRLVAYADQCLPRSAGFDDVLLAVPDLLDKNMLRRYYSSAVLDSDAARYAFVEPDLEPLPLSSPTIR